MFTLALAVLLPLLLGAAFLLGRHLPRRREGADNFSPVTRQHFEIFQGGHMNEAAIEAAKQRFRRLLDNGQEAAVEASLRPGIHYVFQVRALAEIGTDAAGKILERQLHRHLTDDQLEQAWYWVDLAGSLRVLHREESLPELLRCAESASNVPLGHFYAAETVCFLGFAGYLRQADTPLGQAALRLLHRALEGFRYGLPPHVVGEARLGEMVENLWDNRPDGFHPLVVRIAHECVRFLRRAAHARAMLADDSQDQEAFEWQYSRLVSLEPVMTEYLEEAPEGLCRALAKAKSQDQADLLQALADLRADAGEAIIKLIEAGRLPCTDLAMAALAWSKSPRVGAWLRAEATLRVPMASRAQWRKRPYSPRRPSLADSVPYQAILRALRGHPSPATEDFLILAAQDWDPLFRQAAFSSMGWWEGFHKGRLAQALEAGRRDPCPEVRRAARAALARLGERAALHWFRQGLTAEDPANVQEAIQVIATEGLTLLWPELDRLADSETPEVSQVAREALERMAEDMERR